MPDWKSYVRQRLNLEGLQPGREAEIVEEIARQLEDAYQESLQSGATEPDAVRTAEQHIQDWAQFARDVAETRNSNRTSIVQLMGDRLETAAATSAGPGFLMRELFRDFFFGIRFLLKNPRFTLLSVVTLAIGIGAATAIFTVINGVLLQPLPYDHPERIVWVWGKFSQADRAAVSPPDFVDYRAQARSFEHIAAMHIMHQFVPMPMNLATSGGPVRFNSAQVTSGFFEVFGARTSLGRSFVTDDEKGAKVVILSHEVWKNHFGADSNIVGKSLTLSGTPYTVIGVAQGGFSYPLETDMWVPISLADPDMAHREFHFLRPIARLKSGVTFERGLAELTTIAGRLEKQYPGSNKTWTVRLQPFSQHIVGDVRKPLLVIFAAICCLLLIACVNVANLLLAKTTARQKEIAIRLALGAGKGRILMQLLAENMMIALPAAALGFLFTLWSVDSFKAASLDFLPRLQEVQVDLRTLIFTILCCFTTTLVISIAPAMAALPSSMGEHLKESRYPATRTTAGRVRHGLAIFEVAASLVLLAGAGLLLKSFWNLTHVDPGFNPRNLLIARLSLDDHHYPDAKSVRNYSENVIRKVEALPGVESVCEGTGLPLVPSSGDRFFTIVGRPRASQDADKPDAEFRSVSDSFFQTLSIPVLRGRTFSSSDNENSRNVVVINEALAQQYFPREDPVGKFVDIDDGDPFHAEVIGIVNNTRQNLAESPRPEMYVLFKQRPMAYLQLAVRFRVAAADQERMLRSALQDIDKDMTFPRFRTMDEIIETAGIRDRLNAILLSIAASVALLLAAIGIYGVLSYSVEQRRHELGVRMALGAEQRTIAWLILHHAMRLAGIGLLLGIGGALALTRMMRSLLYEVSPNDPAIFLVVSLLLFSVSLLACWLPARRATRVDPLITLRYE